MRGKGRFQEENVLFPSKDTRRQCRSAELRRLRYLICLRLRVRRRGLVRCMILDRYVVSCCLIYRRNDELREIGLPRHSCIFEIAALRGGQWSFLSLLVLKAITVRFTVHGGICGTSAVQSRCQPSRVFRIDRRDVSQASIIPRKAKWDLQRRPRLISISSRNQEA